DGLALDPVRGGGEVARLTDHRFFHQRVARTHRDAMSATDAGRSFDPRRAIPEHTGLLHRPIDAQRLGHLHVLAGFDTARAENALVGIVLIKRIRVVDAPWLGGETVFLVADAEHFGGIVDLALAVVEIADRAVELMVAEDALHRL